MKRILFLALWVLCTLAALAQQAYPVDGYVLRGTDTLKGTIHIPVVRKEVSYASLRTCVNFRDSLGRVKLFYPRDLEGFGLRGDDVLGDYISVSTSVGGPRKMFLKKLVEGEILLLEENGDNTEHFRSSAAYGPDGFRSGGRSFVVEFDRVYYVQKSPGWLLKLPVDPKTATVKKKDLKRLLAFLPDAFTNSEEAVDLSELIAILSGYNATVAGRNK